jgi:hypothetical protein
MPASDAMFVNSEIAVFWPSGTQEEHFHFFFKNAGAAIAVNISGDDR